jgi:hypothetical protein
MQTEIHAAEPLGMKDEGVAKFKYLAMIEQMKIAFMRKLRAD